MAVGNLHILVITRGSIPLVGCDVHFGANANWDILVIWRVAGTNLWAFLSANVHQSSRRIDVAAEQTPKDAELPTYRVECHSQWSAFLYPVCLLGIVDDRLMVLLTPDAVISTIAPNLKAPS